MARVVNAAGDHSQVTIARRAAVAGAGTLMGSPDTVLAMLLLVLLHSTALVTATTTQAFTTTGPLASG